jgi:hypothetical protein
MSVQASCAPDEVKDSALVEIADWLSADEPSATMCP